jgi:acyl-CoA thioester hydrolase
MERSSFRYFYPLSVRYNEVDAQGIVFNAHYLTWYDIVPAGDFPYRWRQVARDW